MAKVTGEGKLESNLAFFAGANSGLGRALALRYAK
jgi:NAD(P)-dependent dehydrogenase (short-subunit alcohol dehydrogenase family)